MDATTPKPCPLCGVSLYWCELAKIDGGYRHAHEANGCPNGRVFVRPGPQTEAWNANELVLPRREP